MSYNPFPPNVISTANSTTSNLAGAAVFTGTSEDISSYGSVQVTVYSSHASATDGLSLQQSSDGTNWDVTDTYTISAATAKSISIQVAAKFYRLVYTNGATLTTSLRIQSVFHVVAPNPSSQRPSDAYTNESDMLQTIAYSALYNGTTWDRMRAGPVTGSMLTYLAPTTGHNSVMITASVASTATAETLITITKSLGLAATGTSTSTSITTGKRFHIQAINASVRNSTGTTAGLATIKVRAAVAGATTTASPLQFTSSVALPAAATSVLFPSIMIPDGWEIDSNSATNTYGVTITHPQWVTGSVVATFDISIIGYEY